VKGSRAVLLVLLVACTVDTATIDGTLECEAIRFSQVSDLPGRPAEMPLALAARMLTGLTASDELSYQAGGEPRDVMVIRDGREVARFAFVLDGTRWWNVDSLRCPEVDIASRQTIDASKSG
jgi:hypothetical protein